MAIPKVYTPEEVATAARVTRRTVYNWIKTGHLVAIKAGPARLLIPEASLRKLLTGRDPEPSPDPSLPSVTKKPAPIDPPKVEVQIDAPNPAKRVSIEDMFRVDPLSIEVLDAIIEQQDSQALQPLTPAAQKRANRPGRRR